MILDGKIVKEKILNDLKEKIAILNKKPSLAVIQIGNNLSSEIYIKQKEKMANMIGINFNHIKLDNNINEQEVINIINNLNEDENVDGILVQLPLPKHLNAKRIQNTIKYTKDVDGLNDINIGKLAHNNESLIPCTPMGIIKLLEYYNIEVSGKNVVILGRSDLVGKPLSLLLINRDATVTLCHSKTNNLDFYTKNADILIVAIGKPNFINKDNIKENSIIIDVGISKLENGKICGDVDFASCKDKAKYITPVPGGIGQMTVASLGINTYKAHTLNKGK